MNPTRREKRNVCRGHKGVAVRKADVDSGWWVVGGGCANRQTERIKRPMSMWRSKLHWERRARALHLSVQVHVLVVATHATAPVLGDALVN